MIKVRPTQLRLYIWIEFLWSLFYLYGAWYCSLMIPVFAQIDAPLGYGTSIIQYQASLFLAFYWFVSAAFIFARVGLGRFMSILGAALTFLWGAFFTYGFVPVAYSVIFHTHQYSAGDLEFFKYEIPLFLTNGLLPLIFSLSIFYLNNHPKVKEQFKG